MRPVEILVHVSAPSRGRDDARYRSEARGFLDFEPVEKHVLSRASEYEGSEIEGSSSGIWELRSPHLPSTDNDWEKQLQNGTVTHGSPRTDSAGKDVVMAQELFNKGLYGDDSTWSGQNAEDNWSSTRDVSGASKLGGNNDAKTHIPDGPLSSVKDEAVKSLSRIQDGFRKDISIHFTPLRQSTAVFGTIRKNTHAQGSRNDTPGSSSKTPSTTRPKDNSALHLTSIKETPRLLIERTPALPRPRTAPTAATPSQQTQPLRRTQSDSWQTPPSTIPDSQPNAAPYHLPEITSSPCLKRSFQSSSPSPTRPSQPGAKKPRLQIPSSPPSGKPAPKSTSLSALQPSSPPAAPSSSPPPPPSPLSSSPLIRTPNINPLEIHPPRPKPSTAGFTTHLTPSLTNHTALLTSSYPKYKKTQTRAVHPLERGHWLVPFSGQNTTFQKDLWEFLDDYLGRGKAGWGVWAVRENVDIRGRSGSSKSPDENTHTLTQKEEVLKIYCWGEVVAEVWLIMYMGGKRKIIGLGSSWIDAGGEAVVVMK